MTPSKQEVEQTIIGLELDEREAEALRKFYLREKPGVSFRWLFWGIVFGTALFFAGYVAYAVVVGLARHLAAL